MSCWLLVTVVPQSVVLKGQRTGFGGGAWIDDLLGFRSFPILGPRMLLPRMLLECKVINAS